MTDFETKILGAINRIETDIHTIKRGVYGDPENMVKGLIETDREQHIRIKSLENLKKKIIWVAIGAFSVIEFLIHIAKEFL